MTDTPLTEASINSLDELFRRDPLEMSDKDWNVVIDEMRKKSALWAKIDAEGKRKAPKAKPMETPVAVSTSDFD